MAEFDSNAYLAIDLLALVSLAELATDADLTGRIAFAAMLILLLATGVNSALRDAQIGLAILWVAMLAFRRASGP